MHAKSLLAVLLSLSLSALAGAAGPDPNEPFLEDADGDGVPERGRIVTPDYTLEWVPLEEWGLGADTRANMLVYDSMNSGFGAPRTSTTFLDDDFVVQGARGALLDLITLRFAGGVAVANSIIKFRWVDPLFGPGAALPITFTLAGNFGYTINMPPQGFDFRDNGSLRLEAATAMENPSGVNTQFSWFLAGGLPTVGQNQGAVGVQGGGAEFVISAFQFTILDPCFEDMNNDTAVDGADLGILLGEWGQDTPIADLNVDGVVDGADLGLLLGKWGLCP